MSGPLRGGCLCGAVRYQCDAEPAMTGHCYCVDCRRSSGAGHCTHTAVPEAALTLTGELRFHEKAADSGNLVRRGFCPVCGSPVLALNAGMPGLAFLRAASLDDPEAVAPSMVVYASRASSWDSPDPALIAFAEMPPQPPVGAPPVPEV